ncbi:MAG: hypothetical protein P8182_20465, partial [Deltaproteobacteria bacterium]
KFLTIHDETNVDRVVLESRWTEISRDRRADWQMTLFDLDRGKRFCEWDAANAEVIKQILGELGIKWSEILKVEVAAASQWRLWEIEAGKHMKNCWEVMNCAREPGGIEAAEKGVCPAASDHLNWGRNRGQFAGRYCWKVIGTFCNGGVQEDFAEKMRDCAMCQFFQQVKREEGERFEP